MLAWCGLMAFFIAGIIAVCQFAAVINYWPYDLTFSLRNYDFDRMDGGGWAAYWNSLQLAALTAKDELTQYRAQTARVELIVIAARRGYLTAARSVA